MDPRQNAPGFSMVGESQKSAAVEKSDQILAGGPRVGLSTFVEDRSRESRTRLPSIHDR